MDNRPSPVETIKPFLFTEMMVPGALLAPPPLETTLASHSLMRWSPKSVKQPGAGLRARIFCIMLDVDWDQSMTASALEIFWA